MLTLGSPLLCFSQIPTIPYSVPDICQNDVGIYSVNPNGCTFNYWEWTGQATVEPPTATQSPSIHLRWQASGTLYANCTCQDQYGNPVLRLASVQVTVTSPVSISAFASPSVISLGQQVLLSAEGASNYHWSGEGLQANSGNLVAAAPNSAGVKNYSGTSFSGNNNVCMDTENVAVTVVAPILNIQVERCRESGDIPLASLGLSLEEGNWSGAGIVGESIEVSALTNNVEYPYQYIRTSDSAPGYARITVAETVTGSLSVSPTSSCEGNLSGSITIQNNQGTIQRWEQYDSQTGEWQTISNTSGPLQYQTPSVSSYRAIVKMSTCIEKPTDPVQVNPVVVSVSQINTASISVGCEAITGSLSVLVQGGGIVFWERSNDGVNNWLPIPSSATATLASINQTSKTYYRAAAQYASCPVKRSDPVNFEPLKPIAGYLNPSAVTINCGSASGTLTLQNSVGTYEWQQNTGNGWFPIDGETDDTHSFATVTATQFRVRVSRNQCASVFSNVYSVNVTSSGGSTYTNSPNQCGNAIGNIQLYGHVGEIHHWEKSFDQLNWLSVDGSQGIPSLPINTSAPTSHFRAVITLGNCPAAYSSVTTVTVSAQPLPGVVRFVGETQDAQMINGQLTFYPRFHPYGKYRWLRSALGSAHALSNTIRWVNTTGDYPTRNSNHRV